MDVFGATDCMLGLCTVVAMVGSQGYDGGYPGCRAGTRVVVQGEYQGWVYPAVPSRPGCTWLYLAGLDTSTVLARPGYQY